MKTYGLLALSLLLATPSARAAETDRELVVLILIDALRADHVGAYGYEKPTSPTLDGLAAEGVRFTRAYVNAPWTRPSTASFLTGLHASRHRTETEKSKMSAKINTMAHRLKKAGWKTAGFSANGNGGSLADLHRGFDVFRDPTNTYTRKKRGKTYNGLPTGPFLVDKALKYLRKSKAKKEFLFLFLVDPHDPYYAPKELEKMFLGDFKGKIRRRALWEYDNNYSEDERFSIQAIYDAGIRYSDQAVKQLLDGLEKMGRRKNTTLFITGDHGEGFGEHGFYLHAHHFWEEVIHVPLIAHGPHFQPLVDDRLTQNIDITATILDIAQADSSGLVGRSLLKPPPEDQFVISEYNEFGIHRQAIVGPRYKVIWQRPADEGWYMRVAKNKKYFPSVSFDKEVIHIFDLVDDPKEKKDLAATPPPQATALLNKLRNFVEESEKIQPSVQIRR